MIALDTNVLLRHLTQDDEEQARIANRLIEEELSATAPGLVSLAVLLEVIWVLRSGYGYGPDQVDTVVRALLLAPQLRVAQEDVVERALAADASIGLADRIVHELGRAAGCSETVTFDRRFARLSGVRLLGA